MQRIYKGTMRNLIVKDLEINGDEVKILKYEKPIVRKELTFYQGFMGSYISFEHGTRLADEYEALDYIKDIMARREDKTPPYPECTFANPDEIKISHEVCNSNFNAIKKYYKRMRREENEARKKKY